MVAVAAPSAVLGGERASPTVGGGGGVWAWVADRVLWSSLSLEKKHFSGMIRVSVLVCSCSDCGAAVCSVIVGVDLGAAMLPRYNIL